MNSQKIPTRGTLRYRDAQLLKSVIIKRNESALMRLMLQVLFLMVQMVLFW